MRIHSILAALSLFISLVNAAFLWPLLHAKPLVFIDTQTLFGQFIKQLATHNTSPSKAIHLTQAFKRTLNQALQDYAQTHRTVIFEKKQRLVGGVDVTQDIASLLMQRLRQAP